MKIKMNMKMTNRSQRASRRAPKAVRYTGEVTASVKIEIRAAEIFSLRLLSKLEGNGWRAHAKNSLLRSTVGNELAGWLARELATHDDRARRDEGCWAWDITKPITEQWPNVPGRPLRDWSRVLDDEAARVGAHARPVDELEKSPSDPLDVKQRLVWNADLDAMERGQ